MAVIALDALRELIRHMEWADATVWRALLEHPPAGQDERIRDLLLHLHGVQRAFLTVWMSQPLEVPTVDATFDLAATQSRVRTYYTDLVAAMATFQEQTLTRPIRMPGLEPYEERLGQPFENPTLGETMVQVVTHSTYHRGQVNARLREIGGEPPLVDYIAWIWFGRPAAQWTATASSGRMGPSLVQ